MTVKELIKTLQKMDQEAEVRFRDKRWLYYISIVEKDKTMDMVVLTNEEHVLRR